MCDDALIEDDLLGVDEADYNDDILDDRLLDEDDDVKSPVTDYDDKKSNAEVKIVSSKEAAVADISMCEAEGSSLAGSSKGGDYGALSDTGLDGDILDYEDDLDDDDRDRREDKFASERSEKPTSINDLLPQQKGQSSDSSSKPSTTSSGNTDSSSQRGRGNYRGRYQNSRGTFRPRGGFRPNLPPFPLNMGNFGMPNMGMFPPSGPAPPFGIGMNPMGGPPGVLPFAPNVPPPVLPSQMQNNNWNRRVEAFVRQTAEQAQTSSRPPRSRSRSVSYSGSSSCSCSDCSRSPSPSTRRNDKDRRRYDGTRRDGEKSDNRRDTEKTEKDKPTSKISPDETKKIAESCAIAVGLDADYLQKLENQKKLREEIFRRKAQRFAKNAETSKPESSTTNEAAKRKREKSPETAPSSKARRRSSRSRSPRSSSHRRHKHSHHRHSRRHEHRSSSLERLAQNALQSISQVASAGPPTTSVAPILNTNVLPPMNVPPPPFGFNVPPPVVRLPATTSAHVPAPLPIPTALPPVPQIRTVSTVKLGSADRPSIVMNAPPPDAKERKLKAYLVVVVSNVMQIPGAFKRISLIATSVGDPKKVWQATEDSICIIFKHLDKAKSFLTQYHNQSLNGQRLDVSLHKMYLNLEAMPA